MKILLRGGSLNGQTITVSVLDVQYSTRIAGERVVYDDTGEIDPASGRRIFALRPTPSAENVTGAVAEGDDDE